MSSFLFTASKYLAYRRSAIGPHGIHSPFVFQLYTEVIRKRHQSIDPSIEKLRKKIRQSQDEIPYTDFKTGDTQLARLRSIARTSPSTPQFSAFLRRLCEFLDIKSILEAGTSIGLNSLYMAGAESVERIVTLEGNHAIADLAKRKLHHRTDKVIIKVGDIYETFPRVINNERPQLVFLDADHRSTAIDFYLQHLDDISGDVKCIVIHDIHWSRDMYQKWQELIRDSRFPLTIDLFQAGLLFPNHPMEKQHFRLRF